MPFNGLIDWAYAEDGLHLVNSTIVMPKTTS
jgi:hypothetical protein